MNLIYSLLSSKHFILILLSLLSSCQINHLKYNQATTNENTFINKDQLQAIANAYTLNIKQVTSDKFNHLIIHNQLALSELQQKPHDENHKQRPLYLFIEGDGNAWIENRISQDPTPTNPIMLKLMTLTDQPSLYLGRPCYFKTSLSNSSDECHPAHWTSDRYSNTIINSLIQALQSTLAKDYHSWIIIGHSGGGTLAMLIAEHITRTTTKATTLFPKDITVVTLSGNLDPDRWTQHHQYTLLSGSLNPIKNNNIFNLKQIHFLAQKDNNIPPKLIQPILDSNKIHYQIIDAIDHNCCWHLVWRSVLHSISSYLESQAEPSARQ